MSKLALLLLLSLAYLSAFLQTLKCEVWYLFRAAKIAAATLKARRPLRQHAVDKLRARKHVVSECGLKNVAASHE